MFFLLDISECGDYSIAYFMTIVQRALAVLRVIVPLLLVLSLIISTIKILAGPDEKKRITKGMIARIVGIVVFLCLPWAIGVLLDLVTLTNLEDGGAQYTLGKCWDYAEEIRKKIEATPEQTIHNPSEKEPLLHEQDGINDLPQREDPSPSESPSESPNESPNEAPNGSTDKEPDNASLQRIIIGDSRVVGMCENYHLCGFDAVVAETGVSLIWFQSKGKEKTDTYLQGGKKAIFILLGVNDVGNTTLTGKTSAIAYFNKVQSFAKGDWKDHVIYFVSINGVIDGKSNASNAAINTFNQAMKIKIKNSSATNLKYCDTNSKITVDATTAPDGLHYTLPTYRQIYKALRGCMGA